MQKFKYEAYANFSDVESTFLGADAALICEMNFNSIPPLKQMVKDKAEGRDEYLMLTILEEWVFVYFKSVSNELMLFIHHTYNTEATPSSLVKRYKKEIKKLQKVAKRLYTGNPFESIHFNTIMAGNSVNVHAN